MVTSWSTPAPSPQESFAEVSSPRLATVFPRLKRQVLPNYTDDALRAKVQGSVIVAAVILPDGTVGAAHVVQSLDRKHGLDDEALATAWMWLFEPAKLYGQPVAVIATLDLSFRLP
jgi:TonB family protein